MGKRGGICLLLHVPATKSAANQGVLALVVNAAGGGAVTGVVWCRLPEAPTERKEIQGDMSYFPHPAACK